jgi:ABC-type multidrug transport system permease subunit
LWRNDEIEEVNNAKNYRIKRKWIIPLFTSIFSGLEVIWDRRVGFLKETLVAPISRTEIMIGKTLGGATIALIQGFIVLITTYLLGFRIQSMGSLFLGMTFMFLIAIFFTGLGLAIATELKNVQGYQMLLNFLIMPVFFLSGTLFPLQKSACSDLFHKPDQSAHLWGRWIEGSYCGYEYFRSLQ